MHRVLLSTCVSFKVFLWMCADEEVKGFPSVAQKKHVQSMFSNTDSVTLT